MDSQTWIFPDSGMLCVRVARGSRLFIVAPKILTKTRGERLGQSRAYSPPMKEKGKSLSMQPPPPLTEISRRPRVYG